MKTKITKEIECLKRLHEMTSQLTDIVAFLKQDGLVTDNEIKSLQLAADYPKDVRLLLTALKNDGKLQMLVYTWNVLPAENICIHIITDREAKMFEFYG